MASRRKTAEPDTKRRRPATTPESREQEMVAYAMDLAETQIREGTASAQVITHFLKAGSGREQLEQERITHENELLKVKKDNLESQKKTEVLYEDALKAMRTYSGDEVESPDEEY